MMMQEGRSLALIGRPKWRETLVASDVQLVRVHASR